MQALKLILTPLVAALAVTSYAAPAHAVTEEATDAARDVVSRAADTDRLPTRPDPGYRAGDITATTVSFGADLVVTTTYRGFATKGYQFFSWLIKTEGQEDPGSWSAAWVVKAGKDKGLFTLLDPIANQPPCGRAPKLDRAARTVTLTIPASCLGDPGWVKVGNGSQVEDGGREYWDDARRDGVAKQAWKFGPKVTAQ